MNLVYEQIAERLLEPVFTARPFEKPLDELRRRDAQDRVTNILADPKGAGLSDEQAARRADLMVWLEQRRAESATLYGQDLKVFFRTRPRWIRGKLEKLPWSEGILLDFDAKGFQLRVRTRDGRGHEVTRVVNPDNHQIMTRVEREQAQLKFLVEFAERKLEALVVEVRGLRAQHQEFHARLASSQAQVSALLPKKEKGKGTPQ